MHLPPHNEHKSMPRDAVDPPVNQGIPLHRAHGILLVADTPKGRGIFASQHIPRGAVIDISPVLILTPEEVLEHTSKTCLDHYTYTWPTYHRPHSPQSQHQHGDQQNGDHQNHNPNRPSDQRTLSPTKRPAQSQAIALGLGSLFNHSTHHQNTGWTRDVANTCIVYTALCDIPAGEELCISYGSGRGLWFEDVDVREEGRSVGGGRLVCDGNGGDGHENWDDDDEDTDDDEAAFLARLSAIVDGEVE